MPFTGTTFSQIEQARFEVADIISRNGKRLDRLAIEAGLVVSDMTAAGTEYGPIVAASAALLASEPTNQAFIVLDAAIQKHLADFNALSARASTLDGLISSV